jgi:hypothetical protein
MALSALLRLRLRPAPRWRRSASDGSYPFALVSQAASGANCVVLWTRLAASAHHSRHDGAVNIVRWELLTTSTSRAECDEAKH